MVTSQRLPPYGLATDLDLGPSWERWAEPIRLEKFGTGTQQPSRQQWDKLKDHIWHQDSSFLGARTIFIMLTFPLPLPQVLLQKTLCLEGRGWAKGRKLTLRHPQSPELFSHCESFPFPLEGWDFETQKLGQDCLFFYLCWVILFLRQQLSCWLRNEMVKVRDGGTMEYELAFQHVILQHKAMCGQGPQTLKNRKGESTPLPLPRVWGVCVGGASTDSVWRKREIKFHLFLVTCSVHSNAHWQKYFDLRGQSIYHWTNPFGIKALLYV